jgi:hypothetical protein
MEYKNLDELKFLEDVPVPKSIETFLDNLPDRYTQGKIDKNIEMQMDQEWSEFQNRLKRPKRNVGKFVAIVAASALFIGIAFLSPNVAKIAATIPYLNLIFEKEIDDKPLLQEINDALEEKNYRNSIVVSVSIKNQTVDVMIIDSEEYFNQVKSPIEKLIHDILEARNEEEYGVRLLNDPALAKQWQIDTPVELEEEWNKVDAIVNEILEEYGYNKGDVGIGISSDKKINLEHMPNTEEKINEIKKQILNTLRESNLGEYSIKIYTYDPQTEARGRLITLSDTISNGLTARKEFHVDSVGFTNKHKDYFYIEISTTLTKKDSNLIEIVTNIEEKVTEFLTSKEALEIIKDDKYKVVITSKNGEKLRTISN